MIVVTHEKPGGSRCRYWRATSARNAQARVQVGDRRLDEVAREPPDQPLRRDPRQLGGALLGRAGADDLVPALELLDQSRDLVVRIRHVDVGPDHDPPGRGMGPGLAGGATAPVLGELDQADALDLAQRLTRAVVGAVVDHDDLVGVRRRVERLPDAVDLGLEMSLLVVDREDDRDVELGAVDHVHNFGPSRPMSCKSPAQAVEATGVSPEPRVAPSRRQSRDPFRLMRSKRVRARAGSRPAPRDRRGRTRASGGSPSRS